MVVPRDSNEWVAKEWKISLWFANTSRQYTITLYTPGHLQILWDVFAKKSADILSFRISFITISMGHRQNLAVLGGNFSPSLIIDFKCIFNWFPEIFKAPLLCSKLNKKTLLFLIFWNIKKNPFMHLKYEFGIKCYVD